MKGLAAGPYGHRAGDAQDSRIPLVAARTSSPASDLERLVRKVVGSRPSQLDVVTLVQALLAEPTAEDD